jgi:mono/diheme cytochrome c family protein
LIIGVALIVVAAGIYFMSTSSGPNGELVTPSETVTSPKSIKGEELYADYCTGCHGAKGVGGVGSPLSATNADRSVIENGNLDEGMPAFKGELSPEEIDSILDYLNS